MKILISIFLVLTVNPTFVFAVSELSAGTVEIDYHRIDLSVEKLLIQTACFDSDGLWSEHDCADVVINGKVNNDIIELVPFSNEKNKLKTEKISIHYKKGSEKIFCIGIKVLFEGFPNMCDSVLYQPFPSPQSLDRYSILSFCNIDVLPERLADQPRFAHRREKNWDDFSKSYNKQPIVLHLTDNSKPETCSN